eukprot:TRINITY_DN58788_c0_g1_i1.p1 TRINITY_DN58788_c0_g1~~TRINITY_DN58788_c0_g1_i1.p1  ORF type:complete len:483 (-),score=47.61 TRINITY_DN58788_c0_g1_i1:93-1541(-)
MLAFVCISSTLTSLASSRRRHSVSCQFDLLWRCSVLFLLHSGTSATRKPNKDADDELAASWMGQIQGTQLFMALGCLLVVCAITSLLPAEFRHARLKILAQIGESECTTVSPNLCNTEKRGQLVHICGGIARGLGPVYDNRFKEIRCTKGVLMVRTSVEVYQWVEKGSSSSPSYVKMWCSHRVNSDEFKQRGFDNTCPVENLDIGVETTMCESVQLGACYRLPTDLMAKCMRWRAISAPFDSMTFDGKDFVKQGEYYYYRENRDEASNVIGDIRAKIELVPNQSVTLLALQGPPGEHSCQLETLLPYRLVSDDSCSTMDGDQQRKLRISLGSLACSGMSISERCTCGVKEALLYTCCRSCASGPPEIFDIAPYAVSFAEMWNSMLALKAPLIWKRRLFCWVWLFCGFFLIFKPTEGINLSMKSSHDVAAYLLSIILTNLVAAFLVVLSFLAYSPSRGLIYAVPLGVQWCLTTYLLHYFWTQQ